MGYLHIVNLYKDNTIQLFKECYALEKIHGTSAHIKWQENKLTYFAGGSSHDMFVKLFNNKVLTDIFTERFENISVTVFGEAYGGKLQGMSATYGKELKFVVFDVMINDLWIDVPNAEDVATNLGLEFVSYVQIPTDLGIINEARDKESVQAIRNGCGFGKLREGVVLRPLTECRLNNGQRVIYKHKRDEFMETKTSRKVDPEKLKVLTKASEIVDEWVTPMRLEHVLDKIENKSMDNMKCIIKAMVEDVYREGAGEIVESKDVNKLIGTKTVTLFRIYLLQKLKY
jgi:hypothetical protein